MEFRITLTNVLMTLFYIIPGFLLKKAKFVSEKELGTVSGILIYAGTPFLVINAFLQMDFSWRDFGNMGLFFLVTFVLQAAFMALIWILLRKKFGESKYRLITIGSVLGNVGFFGLPVVRAVFPDNPEVACFATMNMMSMNVLLFTFGVFCLTGDKKYISLKSALMNPTALGLYVALPLYFFGVRRFLPDAAMTAVSTISSMTAPLCMIILGIRLASAPLKDIFTNKLVYPMIALKLIAFPLFCYAIVYFLPFTNAFKSSILILSAAPAGSVILSLAEMHHSETKMAANNLLLSTVLCFITIPLLVLLL